MGQKNGVRHQKLYASLRMLRAFLVNLNRRATPIRRPPPVLPAQSLRREKLPELFMRMDVHVHAPKPRHAAQCAHRSTPLDKDAREFHIRSWAWIGTIFCVFYFVRRTFCRALRLDK